MFKVITNFNQGILFMKLEGELTDETFKDFAAEINYFLYKQGMNYLVFNFDELEIKEQQVLQLVANKLIEICLTNGRVALCGLNKEQIRELDCGNNNLIYVKSELEAFKYLHTQKG